MGEGGSAVFYLGNQKLRYKPISKLFDTLIKKIKNQGFIISDGSNTTFKKFKEFYKDIKDIDIKEVKKHIGYELKIRGVILRLEDVLDYRYNHTLVWKVFK